MKRTDLQETAALAHLTLDESELIRAFPAFEQMLEFFAAMQGAATDPSVGSSAHSRVVSAAHFRPDTTDSCTEPMDLITNAGEHDGRFIVIPNVL
ncbi:MAG: aspartyl/glutamyl-tRNA amidotransferase subunit C [Spirochaetaceae bacterium]|jgi:aspartyl-tRNA(Asn)/glutamyl-tRNA(Gln) amidotransferase subunit C|nr:aspartyl/glutamyl-tRNA amidotransferase subunit C [Spirochaetaceae bacterium]